MNKFGKVIIPDHTYEYGLYNNENIKYISLNEELDSLLGSEISVSIMINNDTEYVYNQFGILELKEDINGVKDYSINDDSLGYCLFLLEGIEITITINIITFKEKLEEVK